MDWPTVVKFMVWFNLGCFLTHALFGSLGAAMVHFCFGLIGAITLVLADGDDWD